MPTGARISLDDYLAGKPLDATNAALMRGEEPEDATARAKSPETAKLTPRALTNDEREWLRRLTREPGWPILMLLLENAIGERQQHAIVLSQTDPLNQQKEVAAEWAAVASLRRAAQVIRDRVSSEIQLLTLGEESGEVLGE